MPSRIPDPTLPPGWEALYDDASGSKYYWNPATNHTTYDRPAGGPAAVPAPHAVSSWGRCPELPPDIGHWMSGLVPAGLCMCSPAAQLKHSLAASASRSTG